MKRSQMMRNAVGALAIAASLCTWTVPAQAGTWVWEATNPASVDWSTPANWGGGVPASGDRAVIRKAGNLAPVVTQPGGICGKLDIAWGAGVTNGLLKIQSGDLTVSGDVANVGGDGNGTIEQSGGTMTVLDNVWVGGNGVESTGSGTYNLTDGTFNPFWLTVGLSGQGTFAQSGGTTNVNRTLYVSRNQSGVVNMNGGVMNIGTGLPSPNDVAMYVGYGSVPATVNQTAGTIVSKGRAYIGYYADATYNLSGGSLVMGGSELTVGRFGETATITMGNAATGGTIAADAGTSSDMYIGGVNSHATLKGWGQVNMSWVYNDGKVIGDGYGTDHLLDMRGSGRVHSDYNAGTSGWYAVNHGGVALSAIRFDTIGGQATHTWGGRMYDLSPVLVNSVSITMGHDAKGYIEGTLLATDRSDLPAFPDAATNLIGVWNLNVGLDAGYSDLSNSTVVFRYDDALAASLGISESDLRIFHYFNGQWLALGSTVNIGDNLISANTDTFSLFAVGVPEPATIGMLILGGLAILRRKH